MISNRNHTVLREFEWEPKTVLITSGSGCSKLMMSLVNVSLRFQMLISEKGPNFLLK